MRSQRLPEVLRGLEVVETDPLSAVVMGVLRHLEAPVPGMRCVLRSLRVVVLSVRVGVKMGLDSLVGLPQRWLRARRESRHRRLQNYEKMLEWIERAFPWQEVWVLVRKTMAGSWREQWARLRGVRLAHLVFIGRVG